MIMTDESNNAKKIRFRDMMRNRIDTSDQRPQKLNDRNYNHSINSSVPQPKLEEPIKPQSVVKKRILFVDDDSNLRNLVVGWLKNYEVVTVEHAREGLELLKTEKFSLVMIDAHAEDIDGIRFTAIARETVKNIPVILINSLWDPSQNYIENLPQNTRPNAMIGRSYRDFNPNLIEEIIKRSEKQKK